MAGQELSPHPEGSSGQGAAGDPHPPKMRRFAGDARVTVFEHSTVTSTPPQTGDHKTVVASFLLALLDQLQAIRQRPPGALGIGEGDRGVALGR